MENLKIVTDVESEFGWFKLIIKQTLEVLSAGASACLY